MPPIVTRDFRKKYPDVEYHVKDNVWPKNLSSLVVQLDALRYEPVLVFGSVLGPYDLIAFTHPLYYGDTPLQVGGLSDTSYGGHILEPKKERVAANSFIHYAPHELRPAPSVRCGQRPDNT